MIASMFGPPSRLAREEEPDDEDTLNREDDDDDGRPYEDTLTKIYRGLRAGDLVIKRDAMALANCIRSMVNTASREHDRGLDHWTIGTSGLAT
jgi:hypothetical protein